MKKLLVILMVVAMASFLFVGCLGDGVTPPVDDEDDEDDVTPPTTVAPIIIKIDDGALVNAAEADDGIIVDGTGRTYAEIKLYIDGVLVSSGDVEVDGTWIVVVAEADLGVDGAKTLYATAEEPGLAVSASSNEITFTLDTVLPYILSSVAKDGTAAEADEIEEVDEDEDDTGDTNNLFNDWTIHDDSILELGTWKIKITGLVDDNDNDDFDTGDTITFEITDPDGDKTSYDWGYPSIYASSTYTTFIPGVAVDFPEDDDDVFHGLVFADVGAEVFVEVTTDDDAVLGYIDVTFDAPVTGASILALTSTWNVQSPIGTTVENTPSVLSTTVARIFEAVGGTLVAGDAYLISCDGIEDLAGNAILDTAPSSDYGIVLPQYHSKIIN